jgi:Amt family ammonium transporter
VFEDNYHFQKVINHVNKDYHNAFKEWLMSQKEDFRPHNQTYVVTGTLILTVGWLFFNAGNTFDLFTPRANGPAKIIMNTIISGCFSGVLSVFLKPHIIGTYSFVSRYDVVALCGGFLTGLVSVTGCCDRIEAWAAVIIGVIGSLVYIGSCKILDTLKIDDPVEATQIHFAGGLWGTIATGFFDN